MNRTIVFVKTLVWNILWGIIGIIIIYIFLFISLFAYFRFGGSVYGSDSGPGFALLIILVIIGFFIALFLIIKMNIKFYKKNKAILQISSVMYIPIVIAFYVICIVLAFWIINP